MEARQWVLIDSSLEKFEKIISEQMPNELKKEKADFVINTSMGIEDARRQVGEIVKKIKDSKWGK